MMENPLAAPVDGTKPSELDPEEVYRLYFEEKLTLKEVAKRFGYKSKTPIRRIFREQGWIARYRWRYLDADKVHELYFKEGLSLKETAKRVGVKSIYQIVSLFEANGWKARSSSTPRKDIDPEEVHVLYFDHGLTMREIAKHYGYSTCASISRIFKEQGWSALRSDVVDGLDIEDVRRLYFDDQLTLTEVSKRLGTTVYATKKVFRIMDWSTRKTAYDTEEDRSEAKKAAWLKHYQKLCDLRDSIFDTKCVICGDGREIIHRKDGEKHGSYVLWSIKGLQSLNPSDWAALCKACHLNVHALMRVKTFEWDDIETILRETAG
ncbi:MAG: hypothetical protein ACXADO_04875 [Candidatus Thorarchaeota archaeon]|jgi:transposase